MQYLLLKDCIDVASEGRVDTGLVLGLYYLASRTLSYESRETAIEIEREELEGAHGLADIAMGGPSIYELASPHCKECCED